MGGRKTGDDGHTGATHRTTRQDTQPTGRKKENTCGVAINMAVGTCWHVDDTDVLWGRTMVSIMAWGHRRFRGGDFCYLQEGTVRRVAIGHD